MWLRGINWRVGTGLSDPQPKNNFIIYLDSCWKIQFLRDRSGIKPDGDQAKKKRLGIYTIDFNKT